MFVPHPTTHISKRVTDAADLRLFALTDRSRRYYIAFVTQMSVVSGVLYRRIVTDSRSLRCTLIYIDI